MICFCFWEKKINQLHGKVYITFDRIVCFGIKQMPKIVFEWWNTDSEWMDEEEGRKREKCSCNIWVLWSNRFCWPSNYQVTYFFKINRFRLFPLKLETKSIEWVECLRAHNIYFANWRNQFFKIYSLSLSLSL